MLPNPKSAYRADVLVLKSTYGDKNHEHCKNQLKKIIEHYLKNQSTVLILVFSIGRTQELLYELENIIGRSN